jgi:hypothetical protein
MGVNTVQGTSQSSYTGTGLSGVYIWGAQVEAGAFPTSYIPTVAASVTRTADAASMTGTNFSSWYRQDEGTLFAEFLRGGEGIESGGGIATPRIWNVGDGTNTFQLRAFSSASLETTATGIFIARLWTAGAVNKTAVAYRTDDSSMSVNASVASDNTGSVSPTMTAITLGANMAITGGFLNGHLRRISYYPVRLSDTELQNLTK